MREKRLKPMLLNARIFAWRDDSFSRRSGLLRSLADHKKQWSAPRELVAKARCVTKILISLRGATILAAAEADCFAAWQTTKNNGLPHGSLWQTDGWPDKKGTG